jgi:carbamoyl-phosphate synthase large subunit
MGPNMTEKQMGKNVLITSAGRRVSLVQYFLHAVSQTSGGQVVAVDMNPALSAACQIADSFESICSVNDPDYAAQLLAICQRHDVSLVIPTIDTELLLLAELRNEWIEKYNINIVISHPALVARCRDKRQTADLFSELGISTPSELQSDSSTYPRFIKPLAGSRSIDIHILQDASQLTPALSDTSRYLHQELVDTDRFREFTVDAYFDAQGTLGSVVPRERLEVRDGEVSKGRTHKGALVSRLASALGELQGAYGCLTLQFFVALADSVAPEILGIEVNPRFGGGYPLTQQAGATYVDWLVLEHFTGQTAGYFDGWMDDLVMLRYDAEVFLRD